MRDPWIEAMLSIGNKAIIDWFEGEGCGIERLEGVAYLTRDGERVAEIRGEVIEPGALADACHNALGGE